MLLDVAAVAVVLAVGNVAFRHFEPRMPFWRRLLKVLVLLAITALISRYFGRLGVVVAFGVAMLPVIYIHGIWLPRHGVNGLLARMASSSGSLIGPQSRGSRNSSDIIYQRSNVRQPSWGQPKVQVARH